MRCIEREEQLRNESTGREARRDSEETCAEVAIDARPVNKKHLSDNVLTRFFHHLASQKKVMRRTMRPYFPSVAFLKYTWSVPTTTTTTEKNRKAKKAKTFSFCSPVKQKIFITQTTINLSCFFASSFPRSPLCAYVKWTCMQVLFLLSFR